MKEIRQLFKKAEKFMASARLLIGEKDFDSSVSRIYYAMFFSVQALLLSKGMSFSSHRGVISAFGEHFIKTGIFPKTMSKILNQAFEMRHLGDYFFQAEINKKEAEELWARGNSFVTTLKKHTAHQKK